MKMERNFSRDTAEIVLGDQLFKTLNYGPKV